MRTFLQAVLAAALVMVVGVPPQPAEAAGCTVAASPASGAEVGASITLTGTNWAAGEEVFVNLGGSQIGDVFADSSGSFSASASVPNLALGAQDLFAFNNSATCEVHSTFQVIAAAPPPTACTISATPAGGAAVGSTITISGGRWASNDTVFVNLGGSQLGQFSADSSGSFSASATVPALAAGDQTLFAFNNAASCEVSVNYPVVDIPVTTTASPATTTTAAPAATTAAPATTSSAAEVTTSTVVEATTTASTTTASVTAAPTTTDPAQEQANNADESSNPSSGASIVVVIVIAVLALGAGAGGAVLWTRRRN